MTATLVHDRPRNPLGTVPVMIAIGMVLSAAFIKIHSDQSARVEIAREYEAGRSYILTKINSAVENRDLGTLRRLEAKYAGYVADASFNRVMNEAMAKASARETQMELLVSKHLDLTRNREEAGQRTNPIQPVGQNAASDGQQRLSLLPR